MSVGASQLTTRDGSVAGPATPPALSVPCAQLGSLLGLLATGRQADGTHHHVVPLAAVGVHAHAVHGVLGQWRAPHAWAPMPIVRGWGRRQTRKYT